MPKREDFLQRLAPTTSDAERDQVVYAEIAELVEVQHQIIRAISGLLSEMGMVRLPHTAFTMTKAGCTRSAVAMLARFSFLRH